MQNIHLLIIDPQKDFVDPHGSLYVQGAEADMDRLALMIDRLCPKGQRAKIRDISVTMDSHRKVDISHPIWWKDTAGRHPGSFTLISASDVSDGRWTTTSPSDFRISLEYLRKLEATPRKYPHTIWPEHCLIGDEGHTIWPNLSAALHRWEDQYALVDVVTKGSNPYTEHFSAVKAEVPDPTDPSTQINTQLIETLEKADVILLAGEALSHCLLSTVEDIAFFFSDPDYVKKMVLLTDATSPVPDPPNAPGLFSSRTKQFLSAMQVKGMRTATTKDFLI